MIKNNKGFSLVELIVVIAIIAIMVLLVTYSNSMVTNAEVRQVAYDINSSLSQSRLYSMNNTGVDAISFRYQLHKNDDGSLSWKIVSSMGTMVTEVKNEEILKDDVKVVIQYKLQDGSIIEEELTNGNHIELLFKHFDGSLYYQYQLTFSSGLGADPSGDPKQIFEIDKIIVGEGTYKYEIDLTYTTGFHEVKIYE